MIKTLDYDLKKRTDKAIINIRLIASRVKRASLEDAMQRSAEIVKSLDGFRKFVSVNIIPALVTDEFSPFKFDVETMQRTVKALQQADIIYNMLTKAKEVSYKEEIKQVKSLFIDIIAYLENILKEKDENAKK